MAEIDVIILNWNGLKYLQRFLPVLIRFTPAGMANIVVADNGSSDDSVKWLEEYYSEIVRVIPFEKNHGFAGGYNRALDQLIGEYAIILNSDIEVTENWIPPLLEAIQDEKVAAVMPKIKSIANRGHFEYAGAAGGFIDRWGFPFCRGRVLDNIEEDNGQYDDVAEIFWATGACMMIKTEVFRQAGKFDEGYFAHMEEIDLCWRIKALGYRIIYTPATTVFHLGGGTLPSGNHRKIYLNARNSLFTLYKNLPRKNMMGIVFMRMIIDGLAAFKFLFEGKGKSFIAVINAHLAFYSGRKKYRKARKKNIKIIHPSALSGYYPRSILVDYFCRGRKTFSSLNLKKIQ